MFEVGQRVRYKGDVETGTVVAHDVHENAYKVSWDDGGLDEAVYFKFELEAL